MKGREARGRGRTEKEGKERSRAHEELNLNPDTGLDCCGTRGVRVKDDKSFQNSRLKSCDPEGLREDHRRLS